MQARHQNGYQYPNEKPARYTDNKTSTYFTKNGITQLGYIREQLEKLITSAEASEETKSNIKKIILLIDGLADKSIGSSVTVANRLKTLGQDLMNLFDITNGAITFNDISLLTAAKVIAQGIAAIEPGDLDPPKAVLKALGKSNYQLCETIKSTMNSIGAQINLLLQLNKNAEESEELYRLNFQIQVAENNLTSIRIFEDEILTPITQGANGRMTVAALLDQVVSTIDLITPCIRAYEKTKCSSITITSGTTINGLSSLMEIFQLILTTPGSLKKLNASDNILNGQAIRLTCMTATVPHRILQLCSTIKMILDLVEPIAQKAEPDQQQAIEQARLNLQKPLLILETMLKQTPGEPTLKKNLEKFRETLIEKLEDYYNHTKTSYQKKIDISRFLVKSIKTIDFERAFSPDDHFSQCIFLVASSYYDHNAYCIQNKRSPGNLGEILVNAMNHLCDLSINICAHDSVYHETNLSKITQLLERNPENITTYHP